MELSVLSVLISAVTGLIVWYLISAVWHYSLFYRMGIPGPMPYPWLGTFVSLFRQGWCQFQVSNYQRYKNHKVYGVFDGSQPTIYLRDPDMIKEVCVKEFGSFVNRRPFSLQPPLDHMLNMLQDNHWKNVRSSMSPVFSSGKVKRMYSCVALNTKTLVKRLQEKMECGEPVELRSVICQYTMDVTAAVGFGIELNSHEGGTCAVTELLTEMMNSSSLAVIVTFLFPWMTSLCNILGVQLFRVKYKNFFKDFVDAALENRKLEQAGGGVRRNDFLQLMLEAQDDGSQGDNDNMSKEEAKALNIGASRKPLTHMDYQGSSLIFAIAGFDTTSGAMAFTLFLLALNPECCRRAQEEVDDVLGERDVPEYDDIQKLEYLDMCVMEAIRMYPSSVFLDRVCNKETTIQGVRIPAGVVVAFPTYALHHDPEIFFNPETYDPERFTAENKSNRHPYAFMPFGEGPRSCIGMRLAKLEVKVALAAVLRHMTPVPCDKTVYPVKIGKLQFKALDGLWVKMESRK